MEKIPVGRTIGRAYSFAFKDFLKILGVMWVPFVIMMVGGLALTSQFNALTTATATRNYAALWQAGIVLLPAYLLMFVLFAIQIVGITQLALGQRTGSPYFYFSLGRPLWRLLGAWILVLLLLIAAMVLFVVGSIVVAAIFTGVLGLTKGVKPSGATAVVMGLGAIIAVIVVYCAFVYGLVRQTFLLAPVVVAESKNALRRAWSLGRGNFWRMFVILLAIVVPFIVLEAVFLIGLVWHGLPPSAARGATPDQIIAWNTANMARLRNDWYLIYPISLIVSVILYGYICGAQAFGYRTLVPAETAEDAV